MASAAKGKKQRPSPSVPCEVFFACTLCGYRSRTVPQLHSHYRSNHRGGLNTKPKAKSKGEEIIVIDDDDSSLQGKASPPGKKSASSSSGGEETSSQGSSPARGGGSPPLKDDTSTVGSSRGKKRKMSSDSSEGSKEKSPKSVKGNGVTDAGSESKTPERADTTQHDGMGDVSVSKEKAADGSKDSAKAKSGSPKVGKDGDSDSVSNSGSKTNSTAAQTRDSCSKGNSQKHGDSRSPSGDKDSVITRKKNVPLGMLKGKKNSLMVIFQHADQTKPLPEGSSFKLRNAGGEQTYLVVANVDVDIIETVHRRPSSKNK